MVVHIPIALLLIGFLFDVLAARKGRLGLSEAGFYNLLAGVVGAAVAVGTGLVVEEAAERVPGAEALVETHKALALATTAVFAGLLAWRWWLWNRRRIPSTAYLLVAAAAVLALTATGFMGGRMVYELGVGVRLLAPR